MTTIYLDNELQVGIFLTLYEYPKGLTRNQLCDKLEKPRTTIFDNINKMFYKRINDIPYLKCYTKERFIRGRPKVYFYIPKGIRIHKIDFKIENSNSN